MIYFILKIHSKTPEKKKTLGLNGKIILNKQINQMNVFFLQILESREKIILFRKNRVGMKGIF